MKRTPYSLKLLARVQQNLFLFPEKAFFEEYHIWKFHRLLIGAREVPADDWMIGENYRR